MVLAQAALFLLARQLPAPLIHDPHSPWSVPFRLNHDFSSTFKFKEQKDSKEISVQVTAQGSDFLIKVIADETRTLQASVQQASADTLTATIDQQRITSSIIRDQDRLHVFYDGYKEELYIPQPSYSQTQESNDGSVVTPMPCKISHIAIKAGDAVKKGQTLMVLEAMKMEHVIKSPQNGVVAKIKASVSLPLRNKSLCLLVRMTIKAACGGSIDPLGHLTRSPFHSYI